MIIAFTGTRFGMTKEQNKRMYWLLKKFHHPDATLIHGGCIGADIETHALAWWMGWPYARIEVYPSNIKRMWGRDWENDFKGDLMIHKPMSPLRRNEIMMERADIVFGAPRCMKEERRSGTWHAIRCAKRLQFHPFKVRKRILIVWPNGMVQEYNGTDKQGASREYFNFADPLK